MARKLSTVMYAAGLEVEVVDLQVTKSNLSASNLVDLQFRKHLDKYNLVTVVNPDQTAIASLLTVMPNDHVFQKIGVWSWELEVVPGFFAQAAKNLDFIWTYSNFMQETFTSSLKREVKKFDLYVNPFPESKEQSKDVLGIDRSCFVCTVIFDFFSDIERKNPWGAVEAYLEAFSTVNDTKLIIKTINSERFPDELQKLVEKVRFRKDIEFVNDYLTKTQLRRLLNSSDVYISLHRSEGFGINLFDALSDGVPVLATGYSGNLEYMSNYSELLVPFTLKKIEHYANYRIEAMWADPDLESAARILRSLYEKPSLTRKLSKLVEKDLNIKFSLANSVEKIQRMIYEP